MEESFFSIFYIAIKNVFLYSSYDNLKVLKKYIAPISLFSFLIGMVLYFSSCKQVDEWTKYNMNFNSEVTISDTLLASDDSIFKLKADFFFDFGDELDSRAIKEKKIEKITFEEAVMETMEGTVQRDFSFMKDMELSLEGVDFTNRVLGTRDSLRLNAIFTVFEMNEKDKMKELLKADEFQLILKFKVKRDLKVSIKIRFRTQFEVDVRQFFI